MVRPVVHHEGRGQAWVLSSALVLEPPLDLDLDQAASWDVVAAVAAVGVGVGTWPQVVLP